MFSWHTGWGLRLNWIEVLWSVFLFRWSCRLIFILGSWHGGDTLPPLFRSLWLTRNLWHMGSGVLGYIKGCCRIHLLGWHHALSHTLRNEMLRRDTLRNQLLMHWHLWRSFLPLHHLLGSRHMLRMHHLHWRNHLMHLLMLCIDLLLPRCLLRLVSTSHLLLLHLLNKLWSQALFLRMLGMQCCSL